MGKIVWFVVACSASQSLLAMHQFSVSAPTEPVLMYGAKTRNSKAGSYPSSVDSSWHPTCSPLRALKMSDDESDDKIDDYGIPTHLLSDEGFRAAQRKALDDQREANRIRSIRAASLKKSREKNKSLWAECCRLMFPFQNDYK